MLTILLLFIVGPQAGGNDRGVILSIIYDSSLERVDWSESRYVRGYPYGHTRYFLHSRMKSRHEFAPVEKLPETVTKSGAYIVRNADQSDCTVFDSNHRELFRLGNDNEAYYFFGNLHIVRWDDAGHQVWRIPFDGKKLGPMSKLADGILYDPVRLSASANGRTVAWTASGYVSQLDWVVSGKRKSYKADGNVMNARVSRSGKVIFVLVRDDDDRIIGLDAKTGDEIFTRRYGFKTVFPMAADESKDQLLFVRYQLTSDWSDDVESLWHATVIDAKGEVVKEFELDGKE